MKPRRAWCSWSREWDELYVMIDASRDVNRVVISRNCSMAGVETKGGIDSKITSRRDFYGPMGLGAIDYRHPLRLLNPPCATACRLSRPPVPSTGCSSVPILQRMALPISSPTLWSDAVGLVRSPNQPPPAGAIITNGSSTIHIFPQTPFPLHPLRFVPHSTCP
jgi:hypothetical protein